MPTTARLAALREDFEAGSNPVAFLPLAGALRRERYYSQAIEVCQKGLSQTPASIAGRTLLGRLYCDIGRYQESRDILEAAYGEAPEATGVRQALARICLRMLDIDRAGELLETLNRENPQDAEAQVLNVTLRYLRARQGRKDPLPTGTPREYHLPATGEEILESLVHSAGEIATVLGAALVSLSDSFETCGVGDFAPLLGTAQALAEIRKACQELDVGETLNGQFDFSGATILVACRGDELILLSAAASDRSGRLKVVFDRLVARLFPETGSPEIIASEFPA